ncbi:S1C family serine protease [Streptomyces spongiae]|uniref:PDZ domain-containing protein n=1 Tax=Streptomyces spongiae TaxID=565072 RepID=A0A5N8XTY5_9ACTN|nr:trypsin-like peptidase domain-containing protein [Streptomyces spongiae]MPY62824.1 PDZ domain-containing protein [Streptomyces spongiae]
MDVLRARDTLHDRLRVRSHALRLFLAVVVLAAVSGPLSGCSGDGAPGPTGRSTTARAAVPAQPNDLQDAYRKVVRDVLPSVVQIRAREDLGSGVVYDDEGHVVTNAHVVGDEQTFRVTIANSETELDATLVYSYPQQDLAVVKLDRVPDGLKTARFGDSGRVEVGQIVLAMGSPLGLSSSVTDGIVSATGRTVTEGSTDGGTSATIANMVQTSAAINPGNSGGALVGLDGLVIGIPTLAAVDPELGGDAAPGIGFAIPASTVTRIADQIVREGRVTDSGRAALGITGRTVVGDDLRPDGVAVVEVREGGAADRAGIAPGDIITGLGDTDITTITSLSEALASEQPGDRTRVTYRRNGDVKTVNVTLGEL